MLNSLCSVQRDFYVKFVDNQSIFPVERNYRFCLDFKQD